MNEKETLKLANEFFAKGDFSNAILQYAEVLNINPINHVAFINKGNALDKMGQKENALECYGKAAQLKPDFFPAHINQGLTLYHLGRFAEAIESFKKCNEIKPDLFDAWYYQGLALANLNRSPEALPFFQEALKINRKHDHSLYQLAFCLEKKGDATCVDAYSKVIDVNPKYQSAWIRGGVVLKAMGGLGNADSPLKTTEEILEPYEAADGDYQPYIQFLSILSLLLSDNFLIMKQPTLDWQTEAVPRDHETKTAIMGTEQAGIHITHYKHYESQHEGQDEDKVLLNVLGLPSGYVFKIECTRTGLQPRFLKITVCAPAEMSKYLKDAFCGMFFQQISTATVNSLVASLKPALQYNQWDTVEKNSKMILRVDPEQADALFGLGVVAAVNGDYSVSFEKLSKVVAIDPAHFDALYNLAGVCQELNRHKEAVICLDQVFGLKPDLHEAHYLKGLSLQALGKTKEAITEFKSTVRTNPNPGGKFHYSGKDFTTKAREYLKKAYKFQK